MENDSAKTDAAGTSSGAAGQSASAREEPDINQDHLRQVSLSVVLSFSPLPLTYFLQCNCAHCSCVMLCVLLLMYRNHYYLAIYSA